MRGTLFQKPLEWSVEVLGEQWRQGDQVKVQLKVKNHGAEAVNLSKMGVAFAIGDLKKVRKKDAKAFKLLEEKLFENPVPAGEESEFEWKFIIDRNGPITDKAASPYLLFGDLGNLPESGLLKMTVGPIELFDQFFELFENFHRFKVKEKKFKNGKIETKMIAPKSREYVSVEALTLSLSTNDKNLELEYNFKVKKLDYSAANLREVSAKSVNIIEKQSLSPKDYLMFGDALDQDKVIAKIAEVLDKVKNKPLI